MLFKISSFKYKMIIFSFVLVGLCLGIFLYYIIDYFQNDKRAYLYEEAFRFGLDASTALDQSAAYGKLLASSIRNQDGVTFKELQKNLIAIRMRTGEKTETETDPTWSYNKTALKELKLPEEDFLGDFTEDTKIRFLPSSDFKNGYFKVNFSDKNFQSVLAIFPESFFSLLGTKKFAKVSIVDNQTNNIIFKSPDFPNDFNPITFTNNSEQQKSTDKNIGERKFFITSNYSALTNSSLIILYDMSEANATLAFLSQTLIWAGLGMFGLGVIFSTFFANSLSRPIEILAAMAKKVSEGHLDTRVELKSSDETGLLANSFNEMMDKIQNFIEELKGKARLESELKLASLVQRKLFDLRPIDNQNISLRGKYISASECAGDWWTVREWDGKYALLLGDATGHGAPSALLTSAVYSAVECIKPSITVEANWWERPDRILHALNHVVATLSSDIMMTFVAAFYDPKTGKMWMANASHEAPALYNLNSLPKKTNEIKFLVSESGPRLGDQKNPTYEVTEFQMQKDDRIIIYTDGLVENLVEPGKRFSERFFLKKLIELGDKPIDDSIEQIIQLPDGYHPTDDISFFMMDFKHIGE